jgi:transcriptional regulator with XRE-family HTH domain
MIVGTSDLLCSLAPLRGTHTTLPTRFGAPLRRWRTRRGLSQLDLAGAAGTTQGHVSFLESGRTHPSRPMVLHLAAVLDVPLRQQNALPLAAGFRMSQISPGDEDRPGWPRRRHVLRWRMAYQRGHTNVRRHAR